MRHSTWFTAFVVALFTPSAFAGVMDMVGFTRANTVEKVDTQYAANTFIHMDEFVWAHDMLLSSHGDRIKPNYRDNLNLNSSSFGRCLTKSSAIADLELLLTDETLWVGLSSTTSISDTTLVMEALDFEVNPLGTTSGGHSVTSEGVFSDLSWRRLSPEPTSPMLAMITASR